MWGCGSVLVLAAVLSLAQPRPNTPIHVGAGPLTPRLIELLAAERPDFFFMERAWDAPAVVEVTPEEHVLRVSIFVDQILLLSRDVAVEGDRIDAALRVIALLVVDRVPIAREA